MAKKAKTIKPKKTVKKKMTPAEEAIVVLKKVCARMSFPDLSDDPSVISHTVIKSCFILIERDLNKGK